MNKKLLHLFQLGGEKKYEFHLKLVDEGENILSIDKHKKIINVIISDSENKDLPKIIDNIISEISE